MQHLSQFMQEPKKVHVEVVLRVVRYTKRNPGQGLLFKALSEEKLVAYSESDWASKSVIGILRRYNDNVSFGSCKTKAVVKLVAGNFGEINGLGIADGEGLGQNHLTRLVRGVEQLT
ncbi:secreted RxLR effector protein 161-like [Hibiscus syriacus]|uniref:secreted RxLR effector protein 161-like n=1 Tax=Hibiscus syriacus TaxID=106335 RepID=UPI00192318C5|nr:secreted RxLR effector protein 161-like [Hibiscus syriacus]